VERGEPHGEIVDQRQQFVVGLDAWLVRRGCAYALLVQVPGVHGVGEVDEHLQALLAKPKAVLGRRFPELRKLTVDCIRVGFDVELGVEEVQKEVDLVRGVEAAGGVRFGTAS